MAEVSINQELPFTAEQVWGVVGTLDRTDWVPGVDNAELQGDQRHMSMAGAGKLVETIYLHDTENRVIEYGVTESGVGITHHRARLQIKAGAKNCTIDWTLAVEPDAFAGPIEEVMHASLAQLTAVLEGTA